MITFEDGIDYRASQPEKPTVARFRVGHGAYEYIVIGTEYGHWHTAGGDVRTWKTASGARKAIKRYIADREGYYLND